MRVEYHPAVERDVTEALQRYDAVSQRLGEEFKSELRQLIALAAATPGRFHRLKPGLHRANLKRFPYHFIYRELADGIRDDAGAASSAPSGFRNGAGVNAARMALRVLAAVFRLPSSFS